MRLLISLILCAPAFAQTPIQQTFDARAYAFTRTNGASASGDLSSAGAGKVITFTTGPKGIKYSASYATYLYISGGTGTAEAALITATTCTLGGGSSCTVTVTTANTHTGAWVASSVWAGAQEAVNAACAVSGGTVTLPAAAFAIYATLRIPCSNITVGGAGVDGTAITRTGDFGHSIHVGTSVQNVHISGFTLTHTINYAEGPPPTVANKPTSGAHIKLENVAYPSIHDTALYNMPYGIELDTVGWVRVYRNTIKSVWDASYAAVQIGIAGIRLTRTQSGYGYPTYAWVKENVITGYQSAARTITVNGNNILNHRDPVGSKFGILIESCEVCWIEGNTTEYANDSGIGIVANAPLGGGLTNTFLAIDIGGNYIDYNRLAGIKFDMSADPSNRFALGTKIHSNWIAGAQGTINGIYFEGNVATPANYIRTAHQTAITGNTIRQTLGAGIFMRAGGQTTITGNTIDTYNALNSFPTNGINRGVAPCTGDALGSSGVFIDGAVTALTLSGNRIGGDYLGVAYDAATVFTVSGLVTGNLLFQTVNEGPVTTAPNTNGGAQAPASRSTPVAYDPAFFAPTITPSTNYIATESGVNNAIAGSLTGVGLTAGLTVTVKLAHTLQAGANTFNYNGGGALDIKSSRNVANNIGTAYAATGVITLMYDGTRWLDVSQ